MTVNARCGWCGCTAEVEDEERGGEVLCPVCGVYIPIPDYPDEEHAGGLLPPKRNGDDELDWEEDFSSAAEPSPCPMCGELNLKSSQRCTSCGEPLNGAPRPEATDTVIDQKYVKLYRRRVLGVGWVQLLLSGISLIAGWVLVETPGEFHLTPREGLIAGSIMCLLGLIQLFIGIFVLCKSEGALLGALIFGCLNILTLNPCLILLSLGVAVESYKARKMARELRAAGYPLTIHPQEIR